MAMSPIITLLSDFGLRDSYVGEMKAVILSICRDANIVDITHEVPKFNIKSGAYMLARSVQFFPSKTIHVAIVDPGVGGERSPIIIQTRKALFVGPDNGLLVPASDKLGIQHIYRIQNTKYLWSLKISNTFHGRDIFAPVAAHLANGIAPLEFGTELFDVNKPNVVGVTVHKNSIIGEIVHIDAFGNIVTNIDEGILVKADLNAGTIIGVKLDGQPFFKSLFVRTYSALRPRTIGLLVGSGGFLEIASNRSNAADAVKAEIGMKVTIRKN